jgi:protein O-GlcNAc transferase
MSIVDAEDKLAEALALHQAGRLDTAEPLYRAVLEAEPENPAALSLLGTLCMQTGRDEEAAERLERAVALKPDEAGWLGNLGVVLRKLGRYPEALDALQRALALKPESAETLTNLGLVQHQLGEFVAAIESFQQAIKLRPTLTGPHVNLGNTYLHLEHYDEAAACFRRVLELQPKHVIAQTNLGMALFRDKQLQAAERAFDDALALVPDRIEAWMGRGLALRDQGRMEEAIVANERVLALDPKNVEGYQGLLFSRNYLSRGTPQDALTDALGFSAMLTREPVVPHLNVPQPDRTLRVGFVSADLRTHPVGQFFGHLLGQFDRERLHVTAFANQTGGDHQTLAMKEKADGWHTIEKLPDSEVDALIRSEMIDILVDLSGHTGGNRMKLFARKPAPIQATWLGYSGTTGLAEIDYIIADDSIIPAEDEINYSERTIRLPRSYLCYAPPTFSGLSPQLAPPPALANGFITFGTYNNLFKISDATVACWAEVLRAVPTSRLLLKHKLLGTDDGRGVMEARFAAHGIAADRLLLKASTPSHLLHFQSYGEMDIALDPFPYNGTTTTCDAFWMGVPLVTLIGDRFISRVGTSLVRAVGLGDLAAHSVEEYVDIARRLANDLPRLTKIRARLRDDMMASPLGDAPRFARDLEVVFRTMWRRWCATRA